jgi:hypothetical protein
MLHKEPEGLTNPRGKVQYKHDTLPWVIFAKHGSKTASSSNIPWQATHEPPTDGSVANGRNRHCC